MGGLDKSEIATEPKDTKSLTVVGRLSAGSKGYPPETRRRQLLHNS